MFPGCWFMIEIECDFDDIFNYNSVALMFIDCYMFVFH